MRATVIKTLRLLSVILLAVCVFASPAYAKKHEGDEKKAIKGEGDTYFIKLDPMILPVMNTDGVSEVVSIIVALEVKDQKNVESVNGMLPKLGDAYMRTLYGRLDGTVYRNGQFLDVGRLKTKLTSVTNTVLGLGKVDNVLIQGVNQRQFN
jgi:flagellar basal body-associated protein FliL